MRKNAHTDRESKRKLASSPSHRTVQVCAMPPSRHIEPEPWYRRLYPIVQTFNGRSSIERKAAIFRALEIGDTTPEANRSWISRICETAKVTPTELAREAALAPSTLNRFLKAKNHPANLNSNTLAAVMEAGERLLNRMTNNADERVDAISMLYDLENAYGIESKYDYLRNISIIGEIDSTALVPIDELQLKEQNIIEIKIPVKPVYQDEIVVGLRYFTDFPDDSYASEDTIICCLMNDDIGELSGGERVVAYQTENKRDVRATLRELIIDGKGVGWLVGAGGEADELAPIRLGRSPYKLDPDTVHISYKVIAHLRWF